MRNDKIIKGLIPLAMVMGFGLTAPPRAQATITVTVMIDGHQVDQFSGTKYASNVAQDYSYDNTTFYDVSITAQSNAPGGSRSQTGTLNQSSFASDGSQGSGTLEVDVAESAGYTIPGAGPLLLTSTVGQTDHETTPTFQSYATVGLISFTSGPQTYSGNSSLDTATTTFVSGGAYYLSSVLTVGAGGIQGHDNINVSGSITVSAPPVTPLTPLPEPGTLALAAFGLPILGLAAWRRRKAAKVQLSAR